MLLCWPAEPSAWMLATSCAAVALTQPAPERVSLINCRANAPRSEMRAAGPKLFVSAPLASKLSPGAKREKWPKQNARWPKSRWARARSKSAPPELSSTFHAAARPGCKRALGRPLARLQQLERKVTLVVVAARLLQIRRCSIARVACAMKWTCHLSLRRRRREGQNSGALLRLLASVARASCISETRRAE